MPLTMYAGHLLLTSLSPLPGGGLGYWLQVAILLAFAFLWSRFVSRGPLEWLVNAPTKAVRALIAGPGPKRAMP